MSIKYSNNISFLIELVNLFTLILHAKRMKEVST